MNRSEAIEYLTRCADDNGVHWYQGRPWTDVESCPICHGTNDAGHLHVPGSRYGSTSADCAPVAYRVAWMDGETSETYLRAVMSMVVNDHDVPEATIRAFCEDQTGADVDAMVRGYIETQLWAQRDYDHDGDDIMLDENYEVSDVSDDYVAKIREEFYELLTAHPLAVRMYLSRNGGRSATPTLFGTVSVSNEVNSLFGHDFYLTREGHGAGFWDRGLGELGDYLTDVAKYAGPADDLWDNGNGVLQ